MQNNAENEDFLRFIFSDAILKNNISARQLFNSDYKRNGIAEFYNFYE
jgi:hypothetical protein